MWTRSRSPRGHKYETLVYDIDAGTVEFVADERTKKALESYYRQFAPEELAGIQVCFRSLAFHILGVPTKKPDAAKNYTRIGSVAINRTCDGPKAITTFSNNQLIGAWSCEGTLLRSRPKDNVATAIRDIEADSTATVGVEDEILTVAVTQPIPLGHKLALRRIRSGEDILKYGTVIGRATQEIEAGEHVHVHNVESTRARGDLA